MGQNDHLFSHLTRIQSEAIAIGLDLTKSGRLPGLLKELEIVMGALTYTCADEEITPVRGLVTKSIWRFNKHLEREEYAEAALTLEVTINNLLMCREFFE